MQAMKLSTPGGLDNLAPVPLEAVPPAPGQIQVEVRASSLNFHDYAVVTGLIPTDDGRIPMSDGAGVVTASTPPPLPGDASTGAGYLKPQLQC